MVDLWDTAIPSIFTMVFCVYYYEAVKLYNYAVIFCVLPDPDNLCFIDVLLLCLPAILVSRVRCHVVLMN